MDEQGELFEADADLQAMHNDYMTAEQRALAFFDWALSKPDCPLDDCHAATWRAGIAWADVATPQRRAA